MFIETLGQPMYVFTILKLLEFVHVSVNIYLTDSIIYYTQLYPLRIEDIGTIFISVHMF